jgi:thioredoxin 1
MIAKEAEFEDWTCKSDAGEGLILAFFGEPWDASSRRELEIIEEVAALMKGQLKVKTCSVDEAPELAEQFNVRSIPTTLILRDGKEIERLIGLRHEGTLIRHLKKHLEAQE